MTAVVDWERLWFGPRSTALRVVFVLFLPLSLLYALGSRVWHALYDVGLRRPVRVDGARIISVGNLVAGGSGKTPVVIYLCLRALAAGKHVAVLSRGYGRTSTARVRFDATHLPPTSEVGDEARLIARSCPGVVVWCGADRVATARAAVADGAEVIFLDDGFQSRSLARDVDILVDVGVGNGWPLPAGPLRELPSARSRQALIWGREGKPGTIATVDTFRRVRCPDGSVTDVGLLRGREVAAVVGVARPSRFLRALSGIGALVRASFVFPDHHPFSGAEEAAIWAQASANGWMIVTTEKDAERLQRPAHALVLELELAGESALPESLRFG